MEDSGRCLHSERMDMGERRRRDNQNILDLPYSHGLSGYVSAKEIIFFILPYFCSYVRVIWKRIVDIRSKIENL